MTENETNYRSFLLRLWCQVEADGQSYRIILVDPHSDQRWGFTDMGELTSFLQEQTTVLCADDKNI